MTAGPPEAATDASRSNRSRSKFDPQAAAGSQGKKRSISLADDVDDLIDNKAAFTVDAELPAPTA